MLLPLNPDEESTVVKEVLARVGAKDIAFRVDPSILGGLVIKVGDKVMDNSVAGRLEGLRQNSKIDRIANAEGFGATIARTLFYLT